MKLYLSGKITTDPNYKNKFKQAEKALTNLGHTVMNPACLPKGFEWEEYLRINYAMIDVCDGIVLLSDWEDSPGANEEKKYAKDKGKKIMFYEHIRSEAFIKPLKGLCYELRVKEIAAKKKGGAYKSKKHALLALEWSIDYIEKNLKKGGTVNVYDRT